MDFPTLGDTGTTKAVSTKLLTLPAILKLRNGSLCTGRSMATGGFG